MTAHEEERIAAAVREDLALLLKEYARAGYRATHGPEADDFEWMWAEAFGAESSAKAMWTAAPRRGIS